MVDNKPLMEQVYEYENLTADVLNEDMKMCEIFQANVLLEKFPPSWSDYRNQLKHKKNNLTLQELISHMRTEEANRLKDKMEELFLNSSKAILVESSGTVVKDMFKGKHKKVSKKEYMKKKNQFNKPESHIQNFKGPCFVCEKVGHRAAKCYQTKGQDSKKEGQSDVQAHLANGNEVIVAVVVEANRVANKIDWVLDTGASRYFCANTNLLMTLRSSLMASVYIWVTPLLL
ncbi:hypothetical protein KY285_026831 [Solanum tuberosum]|nr:hypothetical protein KY289_027033 [Solanum tuberosum]KAH0661918.1 hypothetical protein KY284_026849 [Solanum tuberosum]KAH0665625.1 hypothetical protein KY285_026831 [Solanum tuberosum]